MAKRHYHAHETAREDAVNGLPLATFGQRALGFAIDFALTLLLWAPIITAWRFLVTHEWNGHTNLDYKFDPRDHETFVFIFVYFMLANFFGNGQTPGKWIARTRAVSLTHPRLGFWQSTERALGYGASLLEAGFGFLQYFISRNRMCVHDRIAETIVVDVRKSAKRLHTGIRKGTKSDAETLAG